MHAAFILSVLFIGACQSRARREDAPPSAPPDAGARADVASGPPGPALPLDASVTQPDRAPGAPADSRPAPACDPITYDPNPQPCQPESSGCLGRARTDSEWDACLSADPACRSCVSDEFTACVGSRGGPCAHEFGCGNECLLAACGVVDDACAQRAAEPGGAGASELDAFRSCAARDVPEVRDCAARAYGDCGLPAECGNGEVEYNEYCDGDCPAACPAGCTLRGSAARCDAVCVDVNDERCSCTPSCGGRTCGPDGCGGSCGSCGASEQCTSAGSCAPVCVPSCTGRTCGPDGCGGSCGSCPSGRSCRPDGHCEACVPACAGRTCGPDGCGGACGACASGERCSTDGTCECAPACSGRECGPDGCGGACGSCFGGETCTSAGQCLCVPSCAGRSCGSDGCGGSCGSCGLGSRCSGSQCVVDPDACDPVSNVGCAAPNECIVVSGEQTRCALLGSGRRGASCSASLLCDGGYACFAGTCRKICERATDAGCLGGEVCAQVSGWIRYGACADAP